MGFDTEVRAPETHGHTKRLLSQWLANFKNGIHRVQRATFRYVFDGKEFRIKRVNILYNRSAGASTSFGCYSGSFEGA